MRRFLAAGAALLFIAGCQSKSVNEMGYAEMKTYVAQLIQRCHAEGVTSRKEMEMCVHQEARADESKRLNAIETRKAIGRALTAAGQSYDANRPRMTSCSTFGTTTSCTTY